MTACKFLPPRMLLPPIRRNLSINLFFRYAAVGFDLVLNLFNDLFES